MGFETLGQLADTLKGVVRVTGGEATILTLPPIRDGLIDLLADAALQGERPELRAMARWLIGKLAPQMGVTLRADLTDRSGRFTRVSVECDVSSFYSFLRARFRHFLDAGGGLDLVGGDLQRFSLEYSERIIFERDSLSPWGRGKGEGEGRKSLSARQPNEVDDPCLTNHPHPDPLPSRERGRRAAFQIFPNTCSGLHIIFMNTDLTAAVTSAGARSGLDAVAVAAAIQEGFCGEIFLPVAETPDAPWRLFAVRSEMVTNARVVEKTLWEELVSAQSEGISGVVVRGAEDAGSP